MKPILVLYATREGHTRHLAAHLGVTLGAQRLSSDLVDAAHIPDGFSLTNYSAAIIAASIHLGKHEREMTKFVKQHVAELERMPNAFISVSLSEAGAEDQNASPDMRAKARADVKQMIGAFLAKTGWHPLHVRAVAGALMYRKYNFVVRYALKGIARKAGAPTDTSRNYQFTDWAELDRLVVELVQNVSAEMPKSGALGKASMSTWL